MAKFVFQLERVLELRRREERAEQRAVAALQRGRIELENQIRARQHALEAGWCDVRAALRPGEGPADLIAVRRQAQASVRIQGQAQELAIRLAGELKKIEAAQAKLAEARARRRAIELLREKRRDEWARAEARREAAAIDDIVTAKAYREARP